MPVPGGVGPVRISMVLKQTDDSAEKTAELLKNLHKNCDVKRLTFFRVNLFFIFFSKNLLILPVLGENV
jgi:5,10-methylene-tetrahydrofolate dehydrogenase/methenyl tetrahydrofolate cyclohydrolase